MGFGVDGRKEERLGGRRDLYTRTMNPDQEGIESRRQEEKLGQGDGERDGRLYIHEKRILIRKVLILDDVFASWKTFRKADQSYELINPYAWIRTDP